MGEKVGNVEMNDGKEEEEERRKKSKFSFLKLKGDVAQHVSPEKLSERVGPPC